MTLQEKLIIELNCISRLNISEIEKKRRMSVLVDNYTIEVLKSAQ